MAITAAELSPVVRGQNTPGVGYQIMCTLAFASGHTSTGVVVGFEKWFDNFIYGAIPIKDTVNDGGWHMSLVSGASTASYLIQVYGMPSGATSGALATTASVAFDVSTVDGQTWTAWGY